jgi:hypothetical protein
MRSPSTVALLTVVTCWLASPLFAADGVLIVQQATVNGKTAMNQVQLEKTRMRSDIAGPMGEKMATIFDSSKQVMWIVNYDTKSYMEMTKADIDRTGAQVNAAMSQLEEQLKNMPPAQRAQVEAMMRGRGVGAAAGRGIGRGAAARAQYRKSGTDTVGRWTCDKYDGYQNEQKVSELCTVDPKVLNLTPADLEITRQLASFFENLMPQVASSLFRIGSDDQGFSGVPVRSVNGIGGRQTVVELKDVTRQTFADSTFAVPTGFQKQQMPGGPGRQ